LQFKTDVWQLPKDWPFLPMTFGYAGGDFEALYQVHPKITFVYLLKMDG
jgi:hypothetical protein